MYQRLVVPLDGSDIAERALVEAEKMALLTGAPLHLVRVIDFSTQDMSGAYGMMVDPTTISVLLADETESSRQYLESIARRVEEKGRQATSELLRGPVALQLVAIARPGDLFVMASHGRSGISRWFMGSVAEEVVRRSTVPVLLLKAAPPEETRAGTESRYALGAPDTGARSPDAARSW